MLTFFFQMQFFPNLFVSSLQIIIFELFGIFDFLYLFICLFSLHFFAPIFMTFFPPEIFLDLSQSASLSDYWYLQYLRAPFDEANC